MFYTQSASLSLSGGGVGMWGSHHSCPNWKNSQRYNCTGLAKHSFDAWMVYYINTGSFKRKSETFWWFAFIDEFSTIFALNWSIHAIHLVMFKNTHFYANIKIIFHFKIISPKNLQNNVCQRSLQRWIISFESKRVCCIFKILSFVVFFLFHIILKSAISTRSSWLMFVNKSIGWSSASSKWNCFVYFIQTNAMFECNSMHSVFLHFSSNIDGLNIKLRNIVQDLCFHLNVAVAHWFSY